MEKETSILALTDGQIGKMFRELYVENEEFVMATFGQNPNLPLTPKEVVGKLRETGMDRYATQLYIFAAGLMLPVMGTGGKFFKDIKAWRAAYKLADDLGVPVDTIAPETALRYLEGKGEKP